MPAEVYLNDVKIYRAKPKTPLRLTITVGNAQIGGVNLEWNGKLTERKRLKNIAIGKAGEDVRGEILGTLVKVKDVNKKTNRTSVTYTFTGGKKPATFKYAMDVEGTGGYVNYNIDFLFV